MTGRWFRVLVAFTLIPVALVMLPGTAAAAVTVSRAEVSGSQLRIEGRATANRSITVDSVALGTSSGSGNFKITRSGYTRPADCTVDVNDGSPTPVNVRLSGCTVTTPPPPPPPGAAALASVAVNPATAQGGTTVAATVTLTAPAPGTGVVVTLSSSNPGVVSVPATITVPGGVNSWVTFVSTTPVTTTTTAVVSATLAGVTRSTTMTITAPVPQPAAALDLIQLDPSTVQRGTVRTSATLYFTALTPAGGAVVNLSSSAPTTATAPATVTIPANSSTGAFDVTINSAATGAASISATYAGVTRTAVLTVSAVSLFRIITDPALPHATVGENYAGFIEVCCGQGTPYTWSLISGTVPDGLRFAGNDLRLTRTTGVTGIPTRAQTTTFTVRAQDGAGNTDTDTFTLTVDPANPLVITNGGDQLAQGRVGAAYETGLFPGGGVPPWRWSLTAGTLPPGLTVQASPGRVKGTPTAAGTFTFTVRVDDSNGQFAVRQFSITIIP